MICLISKKNIHRVDSTKRLHFEINSRHVACMNINLIYLNLDIGRELFKLSEIFLTSLEIIYQFLI